MWLGTAITLALPTAMRLRTGLNTTGRDRTWLPRQESGLREGKHRGSQKHKGPLVSPKETQTRPPASRRQCFATFKLASTKSSRFLCTKECDLVKNPLHPIHGPAVGGESDW